MCIGAGFAIYEMCLTISYLIKNFTITSVNSEIKFNPLITLKPVGVKVLFSKR
jgi:cytochrome P450